MVSLSLGQGTTANFLAQEFEILKLNDKRLNQRALKLLHTLQAKLTRCIRRLFHDATDMRQAYDFLNNQKVNQTALFTPHQACTR